jgi:hypothetical protein
MFIERNRLIQLNKDIFGGGLNQTKKLDPDYGRIVMPDPSLPKIKRYNIKSNNPLGYLMNANQQMPIQSQVQDNIPQQDIIEQPQQDIIEQPQQDLFSQKVSSQVQAEEQNDNFGEEVPTTVPVVEETEIEEKKYKITDLGENNILLPPGYSTDDELEYKVINLINEPKENYKLATESNMAKIYKREVSIITFI